ncbi:MAG: ABC transporter permease [Nitrospirota bacterium]|nr:ABC transporter permease [Nitrospirota bacterium]
MFKNYLIITLRNFKRHKGYAFINIAGLAIGIACCILIVLYIQFELSFDKYHDKADKIYLLKRHGNFGGKEHTSSSNNALSAGFIKKDFPEVEDTVRIGFMPNPAVLYEEKKFYESRVLYADDSFFEFFTYPMTKGDPKSALQAPFSVVITEEITEKYFGEKNPMGKSLRFNNQDNFTVTGVIKNVPRNSHLLFDMLCSFQTLYSKYPKGHAFLNDFTSNTFRTYILLQKGIDPSTLEGKFPDFINKYGGRKLKTFGISMEYFLMPLTDIHLHTPLSGGKTGIGTILYIYIFALIAGIILIIACINFMNLATARSAKRAQEVGMRKVLGAQKSELVRQFLFESFFYSLISLLLALGLAELAFSTMSSIAGYELTIDFSKMLWLFPALLGIAIFVGLIAGSYPAFFLAAFQPARVLKGSAKTGAGNSFFRGVLVVMQFSISVALIIGTIIITRQLDYMKNKNPGFDKEQVVVLPFRDEELRKSLATIKNELKVHSDIVNVSVSSDIPGQYPQYNQKLPEGFSRDQSQLMYDLVVDEDFIPTLGMEIIAGRNFSKKFGADQKASAIINETAAKEFGWENPLGKKIGDYRGIRTVIGVIRDYHQIPITQEIKPLYIRFDPGDVYNPYRMLSIRIAPGSVSRVMKYIEKTWNTIYPIHPFDYFFLDESFNDQFRETERIRELLSYFAGLAIFIASLGLFGLASFVAEQRTKEIGIRKVLGASTSGIVFMISRELTKMIVLANAIAWPVAYFVMRNWLQTFPYRENISVLIFIFSGIIVLFIGLATISFQSIKAGLTNPVDSLKYE